MQSCFATKWFGVAGVLVLLLGTGGLLSADADEIVVGGQCDRTGPTKFIGTLLCPGVNDYIKLVNKKGGINGHTVRYIEVEHAYKVDRGVEAYERIKHAGGVATVDYGTPIVYALTPRHMEDKIPGLTPGFGRARCGGRGALPVYLSGGGLVLVAGSSGDEIHQRPGGRRRAARLLIFITTIPPGASRCPFSGAFASRKGTAAASLRCRRRGSKWPPAVLDITRRMRAEWVVSHLFGKAPAISIREFRQERLPAEQSGQSGVGAPARWT